MILVIGKENCSACEMTKTILRNKGVEFEYSLLENLDRDTKKEYLKLAKEKGCMSMPLIIKDNNIVSLKEVI